MTVPPERGDDLLIEHNTPIPANRMTESEETRHIPGMRNFTRAAGRGFKGTSYGAASPGRHLPLAMTLQGPGFSAEITLKAGFCTAADEMFDFLIGADRQWIRDYASRKGWSITTLHR
jgi:hypothetical protein